MLQFAKKKRKRSDSDDDYGDDFEYEESRRRRGRGGEDEDDLGQDSPKVDENTERRKSSRNTKKKKYVDDTDYGFEELEGDNAVNVQISQETSGIGKLLEGTGSEAGAEGASSATPSILGHGGDPEASNASTVQGSTVPGTPVEGVLDSSTTTQSGPNYAFVVSSIHKNTIADIYSRYLVLVLNLYH